MRYLNRYKWLVLGIVIGGIAGYFWYDYKRCAGGSCLITAHPINSIIYGAIMGALLFSSFQTNKKTTKAYEQTKDNH